MRTQRQPDKPRGRLPSPADRVADRRFVQKAIASTFANATDGQLVTIDQASPGAITSEDAAPADYATIYLANTVTDELEAAASGSVGDTDLFITWRGGVPMAVSAADLKTYFTAP